MLRIGQIVATPVGGTHNEIRTVKDWELGGYVGFAGGVPLIVFGAFVGNERRGAAPGDYMAVASEIALVLHIPKAIAEQWAVSGPPRASRHAQLMQAGGEAPGDRPEGCDCANPPPYPGAPGAWGVSIACPVHGDGEEEHEEPVADEESVQQEWSDAPYGGGPWSEEPSHPASCQICSENADPCAAHAQDWRYWQARALGAETLLAATRLMHKPPLGEPWLSVYGGAPADEERLDADTPQRFK